MEGCLCNCSICPSICPLACPPTLPVTSELLAQFLVDFGRRAMFSSPVACMYRSDRNRQMVREEIGQETGNPSLCGCGWPVVITTLAFAAFCQASVHREGQMESGGVMMLMQQADGREVTGVIIWGCCSRWEARVFSWMIVGPRVTVRDLFGGLTQVLKQFPVLKGVGKRAAWLRPIIRARGNRWHRKHHLMYMGRKLCISYKISDRNLNIMKEDCQLARRSFKHNLVYRNKGDQTDQRCCSTANQIEIMETFLEKIGGLKFVFSLGFKEICSFSTTNVLLDSL